MRYGAQAAAMEEAMAWFTGLLTKSRVERTFVFLITLKAAYQLGQFSVRPPVTALDNFVFGCCLFAVGAITIATLVKVWLKPQPDASA